MEFLIEIILEFVLQLFGEVLFELIFKFIADILYFIFSRFLLLFEVKLERHPSLGAGMLICGFLGTAAGFISMVILPFFLMKSFGMRLLNLLISPILVGLIVMMIGRALEKTLKKSFPFETFANGFAFAFCLALIRWIVLGWN